MMDDDGAGRWWWSRECAENEGTCAAQSARSHTPILETELPEGTARTERGSNIGDVW